MREDEDSKELLANGKFGAVTSGAAKATLRSVPAKDLADLISQLTEQMHTAASELQFELAARLRDELGDLKRELRQMTEAGHA